MTKVLNVVEQVWVEKGPGDSFAIKIKKLFESRIDLLAIVYDEFHAREMRKHFRTMYGLKTQEVYAADYLWQQDIKRTREARKVWCSNLKSKSKVVSAHAQLAEQLRLELEKRKPFDPATSAVQLLERM